MSHRLVATMLAALIALPASAQAQSTPRIDTRQSNQEKRIDQGVSSGELTKPEARRLERGQNHVDRVENRAVADGKVTKRERRRIETAQDVQSRRIYRQKHDRQHRPD
ncbi:MAG: hypothetical protein FJX57_17830 [Alphaproteobacteria bacterium]|nr:hypothetical protein [Alphaproteobacteria bacterium]